MEIEIPDEFIGEDKTFPLMEKMFIPSFLFLVFFVLFVLGIILKGVL